MGAIIIETTTVLQDFAFTERLGYRLQNSILKWGDIYNLQIQMLTEKRKKHVIIAHRVSSSYSW